MISLTTVAATVAATAIALTVAGHSYPHTSTETSTCYEDEPCWDWQTMGNGQRGGYVTVCPTTVDATGNAYANDCHVFESDTWSDVTGSN
jgi:hypothetical protein